MLKESQMTCTGINKVCKYIYGFYDKYICYISL